MAIQVFISYARDDDVGPPGRDDLKGFVTYLDEQLRYELTLLGDPRPKLWRDKRRIEPGEQFDPIITEGIQASQLFLVVLSRNWLVRPWCRRELELFCARWPSDEARRRIVIVRRNHVGPEQVSPLLQGQEGYRFFDLDNESEAGQEQEFFARGRVVDPRYETRLLELARFLWRAAMRLETPRAEPASWSTASAMSRLRIGAKGKTVYLAKPAGDMRLAYDRLVNELCGAGYIVAPAPDSDIPHDGAASFIDDALANADLSVHLLGERPGYAPEDAAPIVPLQLTRAAVRARADDRFRRILWAPRFLGEETETAQRDPLAVVERLERPLDNDTVIGDTLSTFAEFLLQHLERAATAVEQPSPVGEGAQVYIYHRPEDEGYAVELALALRERKLKPVLPAVEGEPADLDRFHREVLRECNAVVLCWATASEVWARATCREWRSWEKLGRREKFVVRALITGPPPGSRKSMMVRLPPDDEIDVVIDLTAHEKPSAEALEPLIRAASPAPV